MAREEYEAGLEVHAELSTKTKIFCSCSTEFGAEPNTHTCPVCMAMPGKMIEKITSIQIYQNLIRYHSLTNHFAIMDI